MSIASFFANELFFRAGILIWDFMMALVFGNLGTTPDAYSGAAWGYVVGRIYPMMNLIGTACLNLFFLIGVFKQTSNIKQNITTEMLVEMGIKVVYANLVMQNAVPLMQGMFSWASGMTAVVKWKSSLSVLPEDMDAGATIFAATFGILFFIVCLVCSFMVFFTVYGRFLQLYVIVACAPIALSTLAGSSGIERTGHAYIRTFLGKCFEIVLIALVLGAGTRMCQSIDFGGMEGIGELFDGAAQVLQGMVTMVLIAASAKSVDSLMRRAFAL